MKMKTSLCSMLLTACLGLVWTTEARAELLAWWPFESAEKAPGRDAAPGGRSPLVFRSGAGEFVEGREPGVMAWNTAGVDFASQAAFPVTPAFSFASWVRREPGQDGGHLETIARLGERNSAGWAVYVGENGNWFVYAYGVETRRLDSRTAAAPGAWTHLAVTFAPKGGSSKGQERGGTLSLYINGRLANQGEFQIGVEAPTAPFVLGARLVKGAASWPFRGQISQAALWDEVLPPSIVADLAKGASPGRTTQLR
jgi:hypothetical protein